ncbi:MAG: sigma-70 family RNA polymerase sigma factor [Bacteroidia bacterium]
MKYFSETFINDCRRKDRKAQKQLFEQLYAPLFRVCMRYVNREADAEDCLMRGFMKAFQNLDRFKFEGEHSFFAWIRKIMVNESLMFLRQRNNFILIVDEEVADISFEAETIQRMDAEELYSLILKLPAGYRTVFNLNAIEGYDHKEIAKMLKITESTSRTQLAKARNKLKILLDQKDMSYEKQRK